MTDPRDMTDGQLADYLEESADDIMEFGQSSAAYRMRLAARHLRERDEHDDE